PRRRRRDEDYDDYDDDRPRRRLPRRDDYDDDDFEDRPRRGRRVSAGEVRAAVAAPAIALIILGALGLVVIVIILILQSSGSGSRLFKYETTAGRFGQPVRDETTEWILAIIFSVVWVGWSVFTLVGGLVMKGLSGRGFPMAACIVAMIPCWPLF